MSALRTAAATALVGIIAAGVVIAVTPAATASVREHLRRFMAGGEARPAPSGPFAVGRQRVSVPLRAGTITIDLWYPAAADERTPAAWLRSIGLDLQHPTQAPAAVDAPLASSGGPFPLIVYEAAGGSRRDDNTFAVAELASHGYAVAAFDEIGAYDTLGEDAVRQAFLDYGSDDALARSIEATAQKVALAARVASETIDVIAADPRFAAVDTGRVGAFGYSFGGAVAAELSHVDKRVRAVVNVDGSTFGEGSEGVDPPYLFIFGDGFFTPRADLSSADPSRRYEAVLTRIEAERVARQLKRPGNLAFVVEHVAHTELGDRLVYPSLSLGGRIDGDAEAVRVALHDTIRTFFDRTVAGKPAEAPTALRPAALLTFDDATKLAVQRGTVFP